MQPIIQIGLGLTLIALTVCIHLATVNIVLHRAAHRFETVRQQGGIAAKTLLVMAYIMTLCSALLIEATIWAIAFLSLEAITDFWQALYFSLVTLTTLGYGDLVPHEGAQMVAAFCAVAGLFLMGLSTAFVIEILRRLDAKE